MYQKISNKFASFQDAPINVQQIEDELRKGGHVETVEFIKASDLDQDIVWGVHYRYTHRPRPYAEPVDVVAVVYSEKLDMAQRRLVCAKELIHSCDSDWIQADTPRDIALWLEKLMQNGEKLISSPGTIGTAMAIFDNLAIWQALDLLFPATIREIALEALVAGTKTPQEIAAWVDLPLDMVQIVLDEDWPHIREICRDLCR